MQRTGSGSNHYYTAFTKPRVDFEAPSIGCDFGSPDTLGLRIAAWSYFRGLNKRIAKPVTKLEVIDLQHRKSNARGEDLPDTLLGCALGAVLRYPSAKLGEH